MFFYSESVGDPYAANVLLLLKGDGENNSTNIVDSSKNNLSITRNGNTKISTTQSKFGGSSIYFDGNSNSYLSVLNNNNILDITTGDFTIELWIYPETTGRFLFDIKEYITYTGWYLRMSSNRLSFDGQIDVSSLNPIPLNNWTHVAIVRNGATTTIYFNGNAVKTGSPVYPYYNGNLLIGRSSYGPTPEPWLGYIDDLRITKGVARYTANFTPPDAL